MCVIAKILSALPHVQSGKFSIASDIKDIVSRRE